MRLAGGTEVVLDADMDLQPPGPEPGAAAGREGRRLGHLGHAEDVAVEPAQQVLAAGRAGDLHVVQVRPGRS